MIAEILLRQGNIIAGGIVNGMAVSGQGLLNLAASAGLMQRENEPRSIHIQ